MDFVREFQKRMRVINTDGVIQERPKYKAAPNGKLYNIHKRSLPVGTDKVVGIGFTHAEAIHAVQTLFKTKEEFTQADRRWWYYDVVPQGNIEETNIYWNPKQIVIGEENVR